MSVEVLIEAIEAAATSEAERLLADADATVAARVAEAEAEARDRVAAAVADAEPAILGAEARALNAGRLGLAARRTARLATRTEAAFRLAEDRIAAIVADPADGERWAAAVRRLATETAELIGSGELRVRPDDLACLEDLRVRLEAAGIDVLPDPATPPGVRGRSRDGRLAVEATLPVRLTRARAALLPDVAARLHDPGTGTAGLPPPADAGGGRCAAREPVGAAG